ncbi:hypothetical protein FH063_004503 [Azospirillum argentinense]|uniref:Uncharacterized protein n=1 Tax=Azospirillum argentinense TaxID=2970906 RepID=A0A5B0KWK6_9PROT|nr:hypothetical protein FH063_004503 [Azospirillum argentinense]
MPAALPIREELSASELRALARREGKGRVAARMFAIAHALDGVSRAGTGQCGCSQGRAQSRMTICCRRSTWLALPRHSSQQAGRCR